LADFFQSFAVGSLFWNDAFWEGGELRDVFFIVAGSEFELIAFFQIAD
jgi:hypothetical protein